MLPPSRLAGVYCVRDCLLDKGSLLEDAKDPTSPPSANHQPLNEQMKNDWGPAR